MTCNRPLPLLGAAFAAMLSGQAAQAQVVEVATPLGNIYLQMLGDDAPMTVANFIGYIERGDYEDSFFHRSITGFVIQGGGYTMDDQDQFGVVPKQGPVDNEPGISNALGTIAMAKSPGDPDSATSEWFINMGDNNDPEDPLNLDDQNGGFTVFGTVVEGLDVAIAINNLFAIPSYAGFENFPILDSAEPPTVEKDEIVLTSYRVAIPGDTDGDGDIDDSDLGTLFSNYTGPLAPGTGGKKFLDGDTDFDGDVDDSDLGTAFSGYTGPIAVSVPEPASAVLIGLGAVALMRRRRA